MSDFRWLGIRIYVFLLNKMTTSEYVDFGPKIYFLYPSLGNLSTHITISLSSSPEMSKSSSGCFSSFCFAKCLAAKISFSSTWSLSFKALDMFKWSPSNFTSLTLQGINLWNRKEYVKGGCISEVCSTNRKLFSICLYLQKMPEITIFSC